MSALASVPLLTLIGQAGKLVRQGDLSGEQALALIVWPDPERMREYVKRVRAERRAQERARDERAGIIEAARVLRQRIENPDLAIPFAIRLQHAHRSPIDGMCEGFVNLGPKWTGRVRCSRRASMGPYCRTHAKSMPDAFSVAA